MNEDKLQALLGAYAAGTLTSQEQEELFALALERQDVFDSLISVQALHETLNDLPIRASLLAQLQPPERVSRWRFSGLKIAATVMALFLVAGISLKIWLKKQPQNTPPAVAPPESQVIPAAASPTIPASAIHQQAEQRRQPNLTLHAPSVHRSGSKRLPASAPVPVFTLPSPPVLNGAEAGKAEPSTVASSLANQSLPPAPAELSSTSSRGVRPAATAYLLPNRPTSPRSLFELRQKGASAGALGYAPLTREAMTNTVGGAFRKFSQTTPSSASENAAFRMTVHLSEQDADLDWRTLRFLPAFPKNQPLVIQVDTIAAGYIAILETPAGGEQQMLAPGNVLQAADKSLRVPLAGVTGKQQLTIIYSPTALSADRITQLLKLPAPPTEETHDGAEHAIYAGAPGPTRDLILHFYIDLG